MLRIFSKCRFSSVNFYQLLGVKRDATNEEIKKQFHILAKQHHPDSPNAKESDQELFKSIVAAYNTLSDENERKKYDRTLMEQQQQYSGTQQNQETRNQYSQQQRQQQYQQRPINPNNQFYYDFRRKTQDFEEKDFHRQRNKYIEDNPLFHSMRKSPELYVVSLILFVIMWRWNSQMIEERTQSRYQSFPEDPEFIREKERDYKKRYGYSPYPNRQILYKVTETECKNIPIDILDEMDESGRYNLAPLCYERLDRFRSEQGAQVIQASHHSEDTVNQYLKLSKNKGLNKKQIVDEDDDEDDEQEDVSKLYQQAKIFRRVKGIDGNHLNKQNIQTLNINREQQQQQQQ
ncbi:unnamed protein product [Paramecium sonneborni]|uniref:J domain-containing protein n=1 Tax=Paramecium sonneborni TaxID=65129 RepID=A0A8S1N474_9CILI|nr:unnamed protein product [Paramecium sonneborni]